MLLLCINQAKSKSWGWTKNLIVSYLNVALERGISVADKYWQTDKNLFQQYLLPIKILAKISFFKKNI